MNTRLFALAFGAHPDDVEAGAGGLVHFWNTHGKPTGIIDLTQGERATNGLIKERMQEAFKSKNVLNAPIRENLYIPDGEIVETKEHILKVVDVIRTHKPEIVLVPYRKDRHSDHVDTSNLVMRAAFQSGLSKLETDKPAHRPKQILFYMLHYEFTPSFIVDISSSFESKMEAVTTHESQFGSRTHSHETYINNGEFIEFLKTRAKFYGHKIGVAYGEPYAVYEPYIGVQDPGELLYKAL